MKKGESIPKKGKESMAQTGLRKNEQPGKESRKGKRRKLEKKGVAVQRRHQIPSPGKFQGGRKPGGRSEQRPTLCYGKKGEGTMGKVCRGGKKGLRNNQEGKEEAEG